MQTLTIPIDILKRLKEVASHDEVADDDEATSNHTWSAESDFTRSKISNHLLNDSKDSRAPTNLFQTSQNHEFQALLKNNKRLHLIKLQSAPPATHSTGGSGLLFYSRYDLYSLDRNVISLSLDWSTSATSASEHVPNYSTPSNPSSTSGAYTAKILVDYYAAGQEEWEDLDRDLHIHQDFTVLELQMAWTLNLHKWDESMSEPEPDHDLRTRIDSWLESRDASRDFLDDLCWSIFYPKKKFGYADALRYVFDRIKSSRVVPSFNTSNKTPLAKDLKQWLIDSSLSQSQSRSKSSASSLESLCAKYTVNPKDTVFSLALYSLHAKLHHLIITHPSASLSTSHLSTLTSVTPLTLIHLYHTYTLQSLVADYVVDVASSTLTALLTTYLASSRPGMVHISCTLPNYEHAGHRLVKGVCGRLRPDFWCVACRGDGADEWEFGFLVARTEVEEEIDVVSGSSFEYWIALIV